MAVLLQVRNAHKSYGGQVLLDGAECSITDDVKVGFVGRNGAGKSTLLKVLLGEEELDRGEVIRHPKLRLGYLRQHDAFQPGETVLDFLMRDSGQPDWKCGEVAGEFEIKGAYLEGPVSKLSGGWQTRVKLAALLLHDPNLLLLDEPTNFLDLRTQILLEHFLRHYDQACLIVSHDRGFLGATCQHTLELSRGKLTMFPGKIDAFLENMAERREHDERVNAGIQAKRKHLEEFIAKNKARASTATRAKSREKQLEKLEEVEVAADEPTVSIRPPQVEPRKGAALRCIDVSIGYPERTIAKEIGVEVDHQSRAAIVGDNGQGKTTFLRTIVDSLKPVSGEVRWGYGCDIGVYAQHVYTSLPPKQTVYEYLEAVAPAGTKTQEILNGAASLLFRGGDIKKKISVLSGGERARLCLAGLMLSKYTVLILDEPGNHLDVDTVDSLAEALLAYKGTVIFTSHDRHFMKRLATHVIEVRDGRVVNYNGNYDAYMYAVNKEIDEGEREAAKGMSKAPQDVLKAKAVVKKPDRGEREIRKEMNNVEKTIARLDEEKKKANAQLMEATDPKEAMRLHQEVTTLATQLTEAEEKWCALQEELGEW
ncbi:ABC-F family ATP-binding cassette domain-containing protein [Planctomyces sp. SH-PL14]|uniref:ABC-F family ATP-binding cassette domain-containing protein n=1 Tax=Planctomyces sp. SH-PL14 TaxID=1632864 RepID=UPI00078B2B81|nr:ABC-F family ATP-binding cassette domain-containing protein [Planctomyces sp. SH-PL14]AMV17751.1 putative ABC transporter ATP-binding protein YheS [Planctomyces sp. SH-PL14]